MSKMKSAQMTAIRFTESDVIVASGGEILTLNNGYTDKGNKNGTMTFRNTVYSVNTDLGQYPTDLYAIMGSQYGYNIEATGDGDHTIGNLFECDDGSTTYTVTATSGDYYWDSANSIWKHQ